MRYYGGMNKPKLKKWIKRTVVTLIVLVIASFIFLVSWRQAKISSAESELVDLVSEITQEFPEVANWDAYADLHFAKKNGAVGYWKTFDAMPEDWLGTDDEEPSLTYGRFNPDDDFAHTPFTRFLNAIEHDGEEFELIEQLNTATTEDAERYLKLSDWITSGIDEALTYPSISFHSSYDGANPFLPTKMAFRTFLAMLRQDSRVLMLRALANRMAGNEDEAVLDLERMRLFASPSKALSFYDLKVSFAYLGAVLADMKDFVNAGVFTPADMQVVVETLDLRYPYQRIIRNELAVMLRYAIAASESPEHIVLRYIGDGGVEVGPDDVWSLSSADTVVRGWFGPVMFKNLDDSPENYIQPYMLRWAIADRLKLLLADLDVALAAFESRSVLPFMDMPGALSFQGFSDLPMFVYSVETDQLLNKLQDWVDATALVSDDYVVESLSDIGVVEKLESDSFKITFTCEGFKNAFIDEPVTLTVNGTPPDLGWDEIE